MAVGKQLQGLTGYFIYLNSPPGRLARLMSGPADRIHWCYPIHLVAPGSGTFPPLSLTDGTVRPESLAWTTVAFQKQRYPYLGVAVFAFPFLLERLGPGFTLPLLLVNMSRPSSLAKLTNRVKSEES